MQRAFRHRSLTVGAGLLTGLLLCALLASWLAPYDPAVPDMTQLRQPPGWDHLLGTDNLGRDLLSRIVYGSRISLAFGFVTVAIAAVIGTLTGLVAGYYGGRVDYWIGRAVDVLMALPRFLLALALVFVLGPGVFNVMLAVGISSIPDYARVARAGTLSVRQSTYVEAAQALGCGDTIILVRHILPNVLMSVVVVATLGLGWAILTASGLSFLGLGAQPPIQEWGVILAEGRGYLRTAWWVTFFPGMAISIAVLAVNLLGDGLRDLLDPRLRQ